MSFTRPSVQTELDRFFKAIARSPESFETISKSAFTQSRKKLKPESFIELTKSQLSYFSQHAPYKKDWKGKRVVGIDGSLLNLPTSDELKQDFGFVRNQHEEIISARCSFAYDVCNELILDAQIDKRKSCEKELAAKHLSSLNSETDILVFDRGYPSQWLVGILLQQGFKFCFRLSTAWKSAYSCLAKSKEKDINWKLVHRARKGYDKLQELGIPREIEGLRLVSIDLPSGEKEVLLTNLTKREDYKIEDLKQLYQIRWGVEESFKLFKKVLHIEHFTGKTSVAIKQDFYAKVFMLNMASMIRTQGIQQKSNKKHKFQKQLNKTQALAKTKDFLTELFLGKNIRKIIEQLLKILRKRIEVIRPNRSNPRIETSSRRRHKGLNSKGI